MKKNLIKSIIASLLFGVFASQAMAAQTATGTFNVNINLTSACKVTTVNDITFNYTSGQTTAVTPTTTFGVTCTNTLPITSIALDSAGQTDDAVNLAYTLSLSGAPTVGTGVEQTVTVNGNMAANQYGKCATAICTNAAATNKTRTITVTY